MARISMSSNEIGPELLKALGVPYEDCISAIIELSVDEPVKIIAAYHGKMERTEAGFSLPVITKKYKLIEIDKADGLNIEARE